jgi:hypothetical protein
VLSLPWLVAPRDLAAGEHVTLGREVEGQTRPPTSRDVAREVAEAVPAGAILALGSDGRLYPLTAATAAADKPGRKTTTHASAATARQAASVSRPARRTGDGRP